MFSNRHYARLVITAGVFFVLYSLIACLPASVFDLIFCRMPAWLASLYLGSACDGTVLTLRSGRMLTVTPACGGSDFFILVCSMIAWYAMAPGGLQLNGGATVEAYWNVGRRHADACPSLSHPKPHHSFIPPFHYSIYVIRKTFILFFLAWAFVNGVNSMRVVLSVWTRLASEALLPVRFDAAVHMVSGVMIFFPALLCVWWICKMRTNEVINAREN